jgi:hypothetical protein
VTNFNGRFIKIEDCAIPSLFAEFVAKGLEILDKSGASPNFFQLMQGVFESNPFDKLLEIPNPSDPRSFQTEAEMMVDSFSFNVMGRDDAKGKIALNNDQIDVGWEEPICPAGCSGLTLKRCSGSSPRLWAENTSRYRGGKAFSVRKSWWLRIPWEAVLSEVPTKMGS